MKKLNLKQLHKQKGSTLVEILLVGGIGAVISAVVISSYNKQQTTRKSANQIAMISAIDKEVANFAASATIAAFNDNISTTNLINSNVIPSQYVNPARDQISNEFGGVINITGTTNPGAKIYNLEATNLSPYACTSASVIEGNRSWGVRVNRVVLKAEGATTAVNEVTASGLCSADQNTIIFTKRVPIPEGLVEDSPQGVDGQYRPETFVDLSPTLPTGTTCPANSVYNGYACTCNQNFTWNGAECAPASIRFRLDGTTVGGGKNMEDYLAGTMSGTPARWDSSTQRYVPNILFNPSNPAPSRNNTSTPTSLGECDNGSTFDPATGGCSALTITSTRNAITTASPGGETGSIGFAGCTNGLVWNAATQTCATTSIQLTNTITSAVETVNRTSVFNGVLHKTCNNGNLANGRCNPPPNQGSATLADPNDTKKVVATIDPNEGLLRACTNGQVAQSGGACGCPVGTSLINGLCTPGCSGGKVFTGGYCQCPSGSSWDNASGKCATPPTQYTTTNPNYGVEDEEEPSGGGTEPRPGN